LTNHSSMSKNNSNLEFWHSQQYVYLYMFIFVVCTSYKSTITVFSICQHLFTNTDRNRDRKFTPLWSCLDLKLMFSVSVCVFTYVFVSVLCILYKVTCFYTSFELVLLTIQYSLFRHRFDKWLTNWFKSYNWIERKCIFFWVSVSCSDFLWPLKSPLICFREAMLVFR